MLDRLLAYGLMTMIKIALVLSILAYFYPHVIEVWQEVERVTNILGGIK